MSDQVSSPNDQPDQVLDQEQIRREMINNFQTMSFIYKIAKRCSKVCNTYSFIDQASEDCLANCALNDAQIKVFQMTYIDQKMDDLSNPDKNVS
jgi:hypothetical protein